MKITLDLTDLEVSWLRTAANNFGTASHAAISLQLKIANAILDAKLGELPISEEELPQQTPF